MTTPITRQPKSISPKPPASRVGSGNSSAMDTRSVMERVLSQHGRDAVRRAILRMGYSGDGSMDDAGCVELAVRELASSPNNKVRDARAESGASPSVEAPTE